MAPIALLTLKNLSNFPATYILPPINTRHKKLTLQFNDFFSYSSLAESPPQELQIAAYKKWNAGVWCDLNVFY